MHQFEIVTDSTCDLGLDWMAEHEVTMVPLSVFCGDEVFLDQIEISNEEYYDRMRTAKVLPHSSQPSPETFVDAFNKLAESGATQVLSVHISEAGSGTGNSARIAGGMVDGLDVTVYDTREYTVAHGLLVAEAVKMRDKGASVEETVAHLDKVRAAMRFYVLPDTLENLIKNGRLSKLAGGAISVLGIKLVIMMNDEGSLEAVYKVRGTKRSYAAVADDLEKAFPGHDRLTLSSLTVENAEGCHALVSQIEEAGFAVDDLGVTNAGPVIATHAGFGMVALAAVPSALLA